MKALPFAVISACLFALYSLLCFFRFNQPFWALTSLIVGCLAALYPLYFERQRTAAIMDGQVAQYLCEALPSTRNPVLRRRLAEIRQQLTDITRGRLTLSAEPLAEYVDGRLIDRQADARPARYWTTDIVDSDASVAVWAEKRSAYPWLQGYVDRQRALLNAGGEVVRLFLFDEEYLRDHLDTCEAMIEHHKDLFVGTKRSVTALAGFLTSHDHRHELSILDGTEVFVWEWSGAAAASRATYRRGTYLTAPEEVEQHVAAWRRLRDNAKPPSEFFALVKTSARRVLPNA